jgi:hypothetical protein
MRISTFLNSYAGMYVVQAFCHSLIAAVVIDRALRAWKISDPVIRQRFSLAVILFPIISFPLYQALNPGRSSVLFRLNALFDSNRWLDMELWDTIPLSLLFLLMLIITSLIFLFQEMVPVLRHTLESNHPPQEHVHAEAHPFLEKASHALKIVTPEVYVVDDDELFIFTATGKNPAVIVSSKLTSTLTTEQMQAALAHELAHIARSRRPVLLAIFFMRMLMFFNPVVLLEFRRAVRNEEKVCDDIAVSLTNQPQALAETLKMFYAIPETPESDVEKKKHMRTIHLEEYSHNIQIGDRIARLERNTTRNTGTWLFPFIISCIIIAVINYFIV